MRAIDRKRGIWRLPLEQIEATVADHLGPGRVPGTRQALALAGRSPCIWQCTWPAGVRPDWPVLRRSASQHRFACDREDRAPSTDRRIHRRSDRADDGSGKSRGLRVCRRKKGPFLSKAIARSPKVKRKFACKGVVIRIADRLLRGCGTVTLPEADTYVASSPKSPQVELPGAT
jgi:hypothetical protein